MVFSLWNERQRSRRRGNDTITGKEWEENGLVCVKRIKKHSIDFVGLLKESGLEEKTVVLQANKKKLWEL